MQCYISTYRMAADRENREMTGYFLLIGIFPRSYSKKNFRSSEMYYHKPNNLLKLLFYILKLLIQLCKRAADVHREQKLSAAAKN